MIDPWYSAGERIRVANFAGTMRPGHDGVTRVLYRMISALRDRPIDTMFISPIVPEDDGRPARMYRVPSFAFPLYTDYRVAFPGRHHFARQVDAFGPDLLHIHSPCSLGYAATTYGRHAGIPVVATYHTHFPSYARYYKISAFEDAAWGYFRHLYSRCAAVFVPSQPVIDELAENGIRNTIHLPHGVDTDSFNPGFRSDEWRRRHGLDGKTVLLFVGRLVWEKDLQTLIGAYSRLAGARPEAAFVIVGDGPIRSDLERAMPGALFLGQLSGDELATAFASADVFVFPSTTETFGNVVVEAMASGLPTVCAKAGGPVGIVRDGVTGFLTTPRDAEDLSRHLERFLERPGMARLMGSEAHRHAAGYSWPHVMDRLCEHYRTILEEYRTASGHIERGAA
jgi:glycosyltransferase involved in cell wall biosynthesis